VALLLPAVLTAYTNATKKTALFSKNSRKVFAGIISNVRDIKAIASLYSAKTF
jgi:hypothetical protein